MRIAMVCPYSLSRPGGVQGQATGLARSLRERGHEVTVVAPVEDEPVGSWHAIGHAGRFDGLYVGGHSTGLRSNGSVAPVSLSPRSAFRTGRFIGQRGFDVVHIHEPLAPALSYWCLARHDLPSVATFHRSGDSRWYSALRPLARWAGARLDVQCAVSEAARATAVKALEGDYRVLFNGIEVDRFQSAVRVPKKDPTILFLGRHEHRKGLEALLGAFADIESHATLWIAGDGPTTERLQLAHPNSPRIAWLGMLSEDDVASRLATADILCAPSLGGESFGMVLLEAMAAGTAVVASDIDGYRAAASGHARLVPPGDVLALRQALDEAVADVLGEKGCSSGGALAAALAHAQDWSMGLLADRYLEIYEEARVVYSARKGQVA